MITKDEILAELENTPEPEKKLHEIAARTKLPVMVIRKILKGLITVVPPERGHDNTDRVAESHIEKGVNRGRWSDEDIQYMAECWNRGADILEIAEAVCRSEQAVRGVMQRNRELFPRRHERGRIWAPEEIARAADMWSDRDISESEICNALHRSRSDFYQLRAENRKLFPSRRNTLLQGIEDITSDYAERAGKNYRPETAEEDKVAQMMQDELLGRGRTHIVIKSK